MKGNKQMRKKTNVKGTVDIQIAECCGNCDSLRITKESLEWEMTGVCRKRNKAVSITNICNE